MPRAWAREIIECRSRTYPRSSFYLSRWVAPDPTRLRPREGEAFQLLQITDHLPCAICSAEFYVGEIYSSLWQSVGQCLSFCIAHDSSVSASDESGLMKGFVLANKQRLVGKRFAPGFSRRISIDLYTVASFHQELRVMTASNGITIHCLHIIQMFLSGSPLSLYLSGSVHHHSAS